MTGPPLREGAVVLDAQGAVLAVAPRAAAMDDFGALPEERAQGALLPGLVNAHAHLELSALAGRVSAGGGFIAWADRMAAASAALTDDERRRAALEQATAMIASGTAAVADVGNGLLGPEALAASGLGGVFFHEILGSRDARTGDGLHDAAQERASLAPWPSHVRATDAAHSTFAASPDLLRRIFAAARAHGVPTSIHIAEDADEIALTVRGEGRWPEVLARMGVDAAPRIPHTRPVAYLAALGAFAGGPPPLLVHMVHADDEDRRLAARAGATAVLCPRSNLHIGGLLPKVPALLGAGVPLALGTDSLASSSSLALWDDIATLAEAFPMVPAQTWLLAATAGGADALGLRGLGRLVPGGQPGIIDVALPESTDPLDDLVRATPKTVTWVSPPGTHGRGGQLGSDFGSDS